jgi:hypothetical protein
MADTTDDTDVPHRQFDADEAHEIASEAAATTFRHHPGAWMDALPAALDTYRTVFDGLAKPHDLARS